MSLRDQRTLARSVPRKENENDNHKNQLALGHIIMTIIIPFPVCESSRTMKSKANFVCKDVITSETKQSLKSKQACERERERERASERESERGKERGTEREGGREREFL